MLNARPLLFGAYGQANHQTATVTDNNEQT